MASLPETIATVAGNLKTIYNDELVELMPAAGLLQKKFAFSSEHKMGNYYAPLVSLQYPWGFSWLGTGQEGGSVNTALGDALAGQTQGAQVYPYTLVLSEQANYQTILRAPKDNSEQSVISMLAYMMKQMKISMRNVLELDMLHGQQGIGAANASATGSGPYVIALDPATTSPGILSILIGARVEFFQANLTSARTAHDSSNFLTVTAVSASASAPSITVTATGTTNVAAVVSGDVLFLGGSRGNTVASSATAVPFLQQVGLGVQLSQTTGSLFGISKDNFVAWTSNQIPVAGPMTPSVLQSACATVQGRGAEPGDYLAVMSNLQWAAVSSSLAVNERFVSRGDRSDKETGADALVVDNDGIRVELMSHPFQKLGQCYLLPVSQVMRIGSEDLTFNFLGQPGTEYAFPVINQAVIQKQCVSDWVSFIQKPAAAAILTGITS